MEHCVHEALIATSAASAILWTGALIVIQLADAHRKDLQGPSGEPPWRYIQFPARSRPRNLRTTSEILSVASLAMLGAGIIAPIFALFLTGNGLRLAALVFMVFYAKVTYTDTVFGVRVLMGRATLRSDAPEPKQYKQAILWYIAQEVAQFLAMLAVLAFPFTMLVLVLSIIFMFAGYQGVLSRYLISRRPFDPTG